ncbi:uroporphyrinogen decarboxylase [bacterium]|nr:uroporphyrinogen decarboxylase [bacterium]
MNNKQRVLDSLNHRQPDKVPFHIGFTVKAHEKMIDYFGDPDFTSRIDNCICMLSTEKDSTGSQMTADIWEDEFGVKWDRSVDKDIGVVCNCMITPDNIDDYEFPDPDDQSRYRAYGKAIEGNCDRFVMAAIGFSLFERAWTLAGMENILMGMISDPDFVHKLFDRILQHNMRIIENACNYELDAMHFGDDWGQQTGLIMGPRLWREYVKPCIKQMVQLTRSKGKHVSIHSCGKIDEIIPDLIEIGLDIYNPFQPEVMDVFEIKTNYGNSLTFWGGISTQKTLPYGTVRETKDEVRRLLDQIGVNGGYIAAPAHGIPGDAKPANVAAMIEILNGQ